MDANKAEVNANAAQVGQSHPSSTIKQVGLVGLGRMGGGMAGRLLDAGFELSVCDTSRVKAAAFEKAGATWCGTPKDVAERCDLVILSLPNTEIVEKVLLGDHGVVAGARSGLLVVDTSTIAPLAAQGFASRLGESGVAFLDAPVSGGSEGARNGTLSMMVGGELAILEQARPILSVLTRAITHVGLHGSGQAVKMVNQVILVGNVLAMSEGLLLAGRYGLDPEKTLQAIQGGAAGSWMLSNLGPKVIAQDWTPSFTIELQLKDLRIALETADQLGVPLLNTAQIFQLYRSVAARGKSQDGNHSLYQALESLLGES